MGIYGVVLLALGVAMDAFAVSICKGITIKEKIMKKAFVVGIWFGAFQGIMPLVGYFLIDNVAYYIEDIKGYLIFTLLSYIGVVMIVESFKKEEINGFVKFKEMITLAFATSLDALSVGMTISLLKINIYMAVVIIAFITFLLCSLGVKIGSAFGEKFRSQAEIVGGVILIIIGLKVLLGS